MKKRVLSLILIMPFIVMLLVFGFSRTVNLFIDLAAENLIWDYAEEEVMEYTEEEWQSGIELKARVYPVNAKNVKVDWTVNVEDTLDGTPNDGDEAYIDGNRLFKKNDAIVTITASVAGSPIVKQFTAYLFDLDELSYDPKIIIIKGTDYGVSSIKSTQIRDFGLYDIVDENKVFATEKFTATAYPSTARVDKLNVSVSGGIALKEDAAAGRSLDFTLTMNENVAVGETQMITATVGEVKAMFLFTPRNGVNVRCYSDLLYCTDPAHAEEICMRTSLESASNCEKDSKYKLFGEMNGDEVVCKTTEIESTYDVDYLKAKGRSTKLYVGVTFYKNVYGNGYTLNAHELTYPSREQEIDGVITPSLADWDIFRGPLQFVFAKGASCYGQDNIGFMIKENVTVDNVTLKNCSNVDNLTNLDYVGTVVEIDGDYVTLQNCQIMNGRTVVRSMSNEGVTIKSCMLSYAREFILKVGSNNFVHAPRGMEDKDLSFETLSPATESGQPIADMVDSTVTVEDCYFHTSGVFSIGMDTHFAGRYLYSFPSDGIEYLAATSYPSVVTLKGDTRFYDWKTVEGLNSKTLINIESDSQYQDLFVISDIISDYDALNDETTLIYHDASGKAYVHGGVAFFGGGRNLSRVDFSGLNEDAKRLFINYDNIDCGRVYDESGTKIFKDGGFAISLNDQINKNNGRPSHGIGPINAGILNSAAGDGDFKFYLYDASNETAYALVGKVPPVSELRLRSVT